MKNHLEIKLINITPNKYMCGPLGGCPAVYCFEQGGKSKLAIVGKKIKANELGIADKVTKNEQVIIVDHDMVTQINKK